MEIYKPYPEQIMCIDTGLYRPGLAACYLVESQDQYALIDAGTNYAVPRILELLSQKQIPLEKVAYVIPTHIHLDHAGGAGKLVQSLPNAKLVIHPRGARHMINPEILQASAMAVYGEQEFNKTYGDLVPVPEQRVIIAEDGFKLDLSGRELLFLDTPGHSYHHFCIYDRQSQGIFSGDTFGLSYQELNNGDMAFMIPTTTPVQFDPKAWYASLDKLMSYHPQRMYLTHFGMVTNTGKLVEDLRARLAFYVDTAEKYRNDKNKPKMIKSSLMQYTLSGLESFGCDLPESRRRAVIEFDIDLNTQGLVYWLECNR